MWFIIHELFSDRPIEIDSTEEVINLDESENDEKRSKKDRKRNQRADSRSRLD